MLSQVDENAVISALQSGVPLDRYPFAAMAMQLGTEESAVIDVLQRMLADGAASRFGAVFDVRRLGYRSELCALDVPVGEIDRIGAIVASYPGVTHCYQRGQPPGFPSLPVFPEVLVVPRLWFTQANLPETFDDEMGRLEADTQPYPLWRLPAIRRFKIDRIFDPEMLAIAEQVPGVNGGGCATAAHDGILTESDRNIVRALQGTIPVRRDLFAGLATELGLSEHYLLERLQSWVQSGTLRRVAMLVRRPRDRFMVSAMCIWPVLASGVEAVGRRLAAWPEVTHCYERVTPPGWPYNLYAMIQTSGWSATRQLFDRISTETGLSGGLFLGSIHEYKKTTMQLFPA